MPVTVTLTDEQVTEVLRSASLQEGLGALLAGLGQLQQLRELVAPALADPRCSSAALRALLVLAAFPQDGSEREVTEVAGELGLAPSTVHRFVGSWLAVGLLTQDPRSRRYRRAVPAGASNGGGAGEH